MLQRVLTVARMQGRDLSRRRVATLLLVLLPLAFYLVQLSEEIDALVAGGIGVGWVVAAAALFSSLASRRLDPRLVLTGYRPVELLLGRLLILYAVALLMVVVFGGLMSILSRPEDALALLLAIASTGVVAVPLGLAIAAVLPRELEGTMVLIGVIGLEMAVQPPGIFLPLYGPLELMYRAVGQAGAVAPALLHAFAIAVLFFVISLMVWVRRMPALRPVDGRSSTNA